MHRFALPFGAAAALAWSAIVAPLVALAAVPDDPCATVPKAAVAEAIGTPVVSGTATTHGPSRSCSFQGSTRLAHAVVTAFRYDSSADAHTRFTAMVAQTGMLAGSPHPLSGVGDEAAEIYSSVYARKGTAVYVFNLFGRRGPALSARARSLAIATFAHLH